MTLENPTISGMPEVFIPNAAGKLQNYERSITARSSGSIARSLTFKYYIHDTVSTLRFQLIGDLRQANIRELTGSWETARTTLSGRAFLLDVGQVHSADEAGRAWLLRMKDAHAQFLPANYLDSPMEHNLPGSWQQTEATKLSLVARVIGMFRSQRSVRLD